MKRSFSNAMRSPIIPIPPVLPVGFRFNPSDEELIGYYLVMLLHGLYCNDIPIGIVNFLEFEPWQLPDLSRVKSHDQVWYFFCHRVVYKDKKKRMYRRKTRAGHWIPTGESTDIDDLGKRSTLRFYKDSPKRKTEWIAYEYEIATNSVLPNPGEFVIIKLMNSSGEKRTKMKSNTSKLNLQKTLTSVIDGSTTAMSTYSMSQQYIQKDREAIATIYNDSYVVSSDYGHENPKEIVVMSTYDIGESSSQDTSCCRNHSSDCIIEDQEDWILASDLDNQKLPTEVEDCPPNPTLCTVENQKLPSEIEDSPSKTPSYTETNMSCSVTSRLGDHFQKQEFNSSNLELGDFCGLTDLDPQVVAELDAFHELLDCFNPTLQQAT